jgi:hypothetical protein
MEEIQTIFSGFYQTVFRIFNSSAHNNFFHSTQRLFSQPQSNQTDPKFIYTLSSLLLQQGSTNLFQCEPKTVLSVRLLLLYVIGIPREGEDCLCWVADYLHEPMTFAPWNSSGAPLCVVTTST